MQPHGIVGSCKHSNLYTDTNHHKLVEPYTRYRAVLEYAIGTHVQCFANRVRAPAAVSGISPRVLFLPDTRQPLPRLDTFQADATPHTNRPLTLNGHQSASALRPMHHTSSYAAGMHSGISPRVLGLPDTRQPLPRFPNRCHSCTDTNQPQLADPRTAHHGPLEYALGPHL